MEPGAGPIHSRFEDDPSFADAIDTFVLALAERVDHLQDTEAIGDWTRLAEGVTSLGRDAEQVGFPSLQERAAEVADAARQAHRQLARKALRELTEVSRRIRQGHRGSS